MISGKEALDAIMNGQEVEYLENDNKWKLIDKDFIVISALTDCKLRLKPRTITLNGIEVPAPFEPKEGEDCCYLSDESVDGFHTISYNHERYAGMVFGLYRPSDVEQVVAALRSIFNDH